MTDQLIIESALTLGETEAIEDFTGEPIQIALGDDSKPKMRTIVGLYTILRKRSEPAWTFDDTRNLPLTKVMKDMTLDEATIVKLGLGEEVEIDDSKSDQ